MNIAEQQERFVEWISAHSAIIHRVVNGFARGDDRKDLLQEVMLAVWKSIPAFRQQAKITTYLYRVSHNAALLWIRTQKNYRRRVEEFGATNPAVIPTDSGASLDERLGALYSAIRLLKPVDRSLILMSLDELSYREMADVLGLTETNIGVRINRIKQQLAELLKGKENEPQ
jgi:RNA polymerase sigma-70 factor (ECF subfamily)